MPMTTVHQPGTVAASRADARPVGRGGMLAILLLAQLMAILDANIVNVAAASIRASLRTTGAGLQMILAGYVIAYSVLLITGARVGGILGARRVFLAGLAVFTAASLACGVATAAGALTAFRFAQGAGAAVMIPQVFSLIQRYFTGAARARALALYGVVIAGGIALGQILGGVLVTADLFGQSWRPVFFINVPVGLVLLVAGVWVLPRDTPVTARRLDPAGLVLDQPGRLDRAVRRLRRGPAPGGPPTHARPAVPRPRDDSRARRDLPDDGRLRRVPVQRGAAPPERARLLAAAGRVDLRADGRLFRHRQPGLPRLASQVAQPGDPAGVAGGRGQSRRGRVWDAGR